MIAPPADTVVVHTPAPTAQTPRAALLRGFTLIEMLVVLMIMGLLVGLVSASAQPDDKAVLRLEADRLAQLMDLAAAESRLTGRPVAWTANGPAYRFWQYSEDLGWMASGDEVLRPRSLPRGMTISDLHVDNLRAAGSMRIEFNTHGATAAFRVELSLGDARFTVANSPIGNVRVLPEGGSGNATAVRR